MIHKLTGALFAAAICVSAQPYSGTIFNFPNSFTDTDPTALAAVTYIGRQQRTVYDRRVGNTSINAYAFSTTFTDGAAAWTIWVNPEFSQTVATQLADKYSRNIGQMPRCTRAGLTGAVIHDGNNPWGGGNPLTIHHGQGLSYENQGIVTETMIHEATHAAFDPIYYIASWYAAASADGQFISTYARDNPNREDHSETFLCWLVARYKSNRISATDYTRITTTVPNRLAWYDGMNFPLNPVVPTRLATPARSTPASPFSLYVGNHGQLFSGITVGYRMDRPARITLQVLDLKGKVIKTLAQGQADLGDYRIVWDAQDDAGRRVPAGNYVYRLASGGFQAAQSMALSR